jgi:hypothetical protein
MTAHVLSAYVLSAYVVSALLFELIGTYLFHFQLPRQNSIAVEVPITPQLLPSPYHSRDSCWSFLDGCG